MAQSIEKIPKRILSGLLDSLSAGVVPRTGAPYVAIGRNEEVEAFVKGLETVENGGAFTKLIIGRYGSGKSFLIQLIRGYAAEKGFVCCDADLSPERRLHGTKGAGLATYRELVRNMSVKTSPDGKALMPVISRWISSLQSQIASEGFAKEDIQTELTKRIYSVTREMETSVGGFDFARAIHVYYDAYISGDEEKKSCALRWLCGEYTSKTEARRDIGCTAIIDDDSWYDYIKLLALFVRKAGYKGLVIFIDECVNLYKITNRISREANYEKLLSMFNDTLQGGAEGLGIVLGGTPQFLEDTRRGLYSYDALKSRLQGGRYSEDGYKNYMGPVIRLERLDGNELFALVVRVYRLYCVYYDGAPVISDEQLAAFLKTSLERTGSDKLITPREIIRDLLTVLNILYQNKQLTFEEVVLKNKNETENAKADTSADIVDFDI